MRCCELDIDFHGRYFSFKRSEYLPLAHLLLETLVYCFVVDMFQIVMVIYYTEGKKIGINRPLK